MRKVRGADGDSGRSLGTPAARVRSVQGRTPRPHAAAHRRTWPGPSCERTGSRSYQGWDSDVLAGGFSTFSAKITSPPTSIFPPNPRGAGPKPQPVSLPSLFLSSPVFPLLSPVIYASSDSPEALEPINRQNGARQTLARSSPATPSSPVPASPRSLPACSL